MPRELYIDKQEHVVIREYEKPTLKENEVRIQSEFSAIKHGTEFHLFSGKSPYAKMKLDKQLRIFIENTTDNPHRFEYPGNITVGKVVEIGKAVKELHPGDRVYTYAPIRETVDRELKYVNILTPPMTELDAVCTDPALFAFTAVRDANARIGDNVVLFGLGAIGLFVVQCLRLSGSFEIIAVDPIKKRRDLAKKFGATLTLDPNQCDIGLEIHHYLKKGADIAIEASGSYVALQTAMRSVRNCGKVVTLGYYKEKGHEIRLGEEWHHNRLTLISSMPVWDNPSRDHPLWDFVRLEEAVKKMFIRKLLISDDILDPIVDFDNAAEAYMNIYQNPDDAIKLGVRFKTD